MKSSFCTMFRISSLNLHAYHKKKYISQNKSSLGIFWNISILIPELYKPSEDWISKQWFVKFESYCCHTISVTPSFLFLSFSLSRWASYSFLLTSHHDAIEARVILNCLRPCIAQVMDWRNLLLRWWYAQGLCAAGWEDGTSSHLIQGIQCT